MEELPSGLKDLTNQEGRAWKRSTVTGELGALDSEHCLLICGLWQSLPPHLKSEVNATPARVTASPKSGAENEDRRAWETLQN